LLPSQGEAYLFRDVVILEDVPCHLATAHLELAGEPSAVLSKEPPSLQTFEVYGQRFGGNLSARKFNNQAVELFIKCAALNRMIQIAKPDSYQVEA
jgi:hypothetical protein